jgi:hypothetical protein
MEWTSSEWLQQLQQLHSAPHILPEEKHSQYIFKQPVFLQLQPPFFNTTGITGVEIGSASTDTAI